MYTAKRLRTLERENTTPKWLEGEGLASATSVHLDLFSERVLFFDYDHCSNQA